MPIEYSCFISYPHGQKNVLQPFMKEFLEGLRTEIYASTRKSVWVDFECLQGGDRWNDKLGADLCKSVCMLVIYTPLYFDPENAFCAREYRAMELLEENRLKLLVGKADRDHGLIIPIVLRGEKRLPPVLRKHQYYKFDDIELADPEVKVRQKYAKEIKKIAEYIVDRCYEFEGLAVDPCTNCDNFSLPSEVEIRAYLDTVLGVPANGGGSQIATTSTDPFPGRANG